MTIQQRIVNCKLQCNLSDYDINLIKYFFLLIHFFYFIYLEFQYVKPTIEITKTLNFPILINLNRVGFGGVLSKKTENNEVKKRVHDNKYVQQSHETCASET